MKFISLLAIAACAVLVSAAPHGDTSQKVDINDETYTDIYDETYIKNTDNSQNQALVNDQKKIDGTAANDNKGVLNGVLGGPVIGKGFLQGGVSLIGGNTAVMNDGQTAVNKSN